MARLEQRDYQDRVVKRTLGLFDEGFTSILIESPVGSGKTIMALRIVKAMEETLGITTNWTAMRRNLLTQASEANQAFTHCENISFISMFDKHPPKCGLLVQDEGHHAATASAIHIDAASGAKYVLALSATPFRTDKLTLSFQKTVRDAGIHRLIQEGFLSPFHYWAIPQWTAASVAHTYLAERDKWGKSIVFFKTIAECRAFKKLLAGSYVHCEVVTASSDRDRQLDAFSQGKYPVIANVAILTEGFDEPSLSSVFVRDSSRLPTVQMGGRGLRKHADKPHCNIIQSRQTHWPFTRTATAEKRFVLRGDKWLALGNTEHVQTVAQDMGRKLSQINVTLPEIILKANRKKRNIVRIR